MSSSYEPFKNDPESDVVRELPTNYDLSLPVAPDWFSEAPKASWKAGYELSLTALQEAIKRPGGLANRDDQRVDVEFIL